MTEQVEPAVFTATASKDHSLAERIEQAMVAAVEDALAHGVSPYDAGTLIAAKMAARQRVLDAANAPTPE